MIEINLVPNYLRKKKKGGLLSGGLHLPLEVIIGIGGGLLFLLIAADVLVVTAKGVKAGQKSSIEKNLAGVAPQMMDVRKIKGELQKLKDSYESIKGVTGEVRTLWSEKLNIISNKLSRGVWIRRIALTDDVLFVVGSAISRKNDGIINVHTFTSNLKKDESFKKGLMELDLGSIQTKLVNNIEVADFEIKSKLKK